MLLITCQSKMFLLSADNELCSAVRNDLCKFEAEKVNVCTLSVSNCLSQTVTKSGVYVLERKAPKITSACKVQQVLVCQPRSWTTCLRSAISPRIFYFALFRLKKWRYVKMKITIAFWTINCTFVKKEIWKNTKNESVVVISVFFVNYLYGRFSAITPAFWPILPVDSWSLHWVLLICRSKLGK